MTLTNGGCGPIYAAEMRRYLTCLALFVTACSSSPGAAPGAACSDGQALQVGFYAFFAPVSYSAAADPGTASFDEHRGYEADLLTALAAMDGAGLSFARHGIAEWSGIWLKAAGPEYDLVGGGITILAARTRDAAGDRVILFTADHIAFRQSLLVRAADAERYAPVQRLDQPSAGGCFTRHHRRGPPVGVDWLGRCPGHARRGHAL